MFLRRPAAFVLAPLLLAAALGHSAARADTALPGSIEIRCSATTIEQSADWYLPAGEPTGLIWLQHGFARSNAHVADLAARYAAAGYLVFAPSLPFMNLHGCTLQNLGDNTGFLDNVAALFGTANDPAGPLATSLATAARRAGATPPALPHRLVFAGHSAGAEAVAFVADRLRTAYPATWSELRGIVLLDPVRSFLGNNIDQALTGIDGTDLPLLTISAPPALCNAFGSGTLAVQSHLHRAFVGVRLPTGKHTDAEGASTDLLGSLLCGSPDSTATTALQTLALGWTRDFFTGTSTPGLYPAAGNSITAAPRAEILTGA